MAKGAPSKPVSKSKIPNKFGFGKKPEEEKVNGVPSWVGLAAWPLRIYVFYHVLVSAYDIRMYAIREYGRVIHEFDPWFNYRATEYLAEHGSEKFFKWYDHMSWYPLGRPVGTTIYPGMQFTAVWIWETLSAFGVDMSLNDVCCFVPVWFGCVATTFLGLITWECSGSANAGVLSAAVMAIIPAHIMRSIGGGYDNESIAVTAMCMTFYFWVRSLRNDQSWWLGAVTGLAYFYMVAVWGGYIFVVNMIGLHAAVLIVTGRYSSKLHHSYSLWYLIGTFGAVQVPVVGWAPLKSLEQLAPFGIFVFMQLLEYVEIQRKKLNLDQKQVRELQIKVIGGAAAVGIACAAALWPTGYFGPLSSRIRGLFLKHTRTGNPLVDSVAEHQPGSASAYWQYMHLCMYAAPGGFVLMLFRKTDQKYFLCSYAITAYYFANKMVRLIIIAGPVASALTGVFLAYCLEFTMQCIYRHLKWVPNDAGLPWTWNITAEDRAEDEVKAKSGKTQKLPMFDDWSYPDFVTWWDSCNKQRGAAGFFMLLIIIPLCAIDFTQVSHRMAIGMSNPQLMFKAQLGNGQTIIVDDYREAYWWLRDTTPEDSRVMAWWDYGYQITGIANRTSVADGNTWNHEHIATLGRMLTSPVKDAHRAIRHLADYVLVWAGGGGDDMAKSPHLARIANSVFEGHCASDPTCQLFGFNQDGSPTPMMRESLLYQLVQNGLKPGVKVDDSRFKMVFNSKYGKVRIYKVMSVSQESKDWVANPDNKVCDAPGSWYCTGQYPPAFRSFIEKRRNFAQLEDFNVGDGETKKRSEKYQKEYMKRMAGQGGGHGRRL